MLSDIVFAAMPIYFVWSLHRPVLERILISILMALGLLAATAEACIIYHAYLWNPQKSAIRDWMPLFWWYRVEEIGLILAACTPFLKPLVQRVLGRFGTSPFCFVTIELDSVQSSYVTIQDVAISRLPPSVGPNQLEAHNGFQPDSATTKVA